MKNSINTKMRLLLILFTVLLSISASADERKSTRDRIQKHREWLNQRRAERKKLENYVETNDPYQKIKYFKKLIKFKSNDNPHADDISFVPHLSESEKNRIENYNNKSRAAHEEEEDSSTIVIEAGNEFAYETINHNNEIYVTDIAKNTSLVSQMEHKAITGSNEKHEEERKASEIVATSHKNQIEKEANGGHKSDKIENNTESLRGTENLKKSENQTTNDLEIQKFISDHLKYRAGNITLKKSWGKWSSWSSCSRSCGKGVKSQSRDCMLKMYKNGKRINITTIALNECIGFYKRFHICNEEDCPQSSIDFRAQQCSEFNDHTFKNQTYEWEPYVKEDAECELNCRPKNQKYFARLKERVIDGTLCTKVPKTHTDYEYAVCVEGKCKAVFSNGAISGSFINSGNVRCGSSVCRPISGIFAKNPLPNGYVHVATIPTGASNITITELENSINLLALKSTESKFIINGNYSVSPSGSYEIAGTSLKYHRIEGNANVQHKRNDGVTEWITVAGPLLEPVHIMVLSQETNPGVKYEYLLPTTLATSDESDTDYFSSSEDIPINSKLKAANTNTNSASGSKRRRKLAWRVIGFTQCSKTCGGGTQQPIIRCTRGENSKAYSPKKCAHLTKPNVSENLMKCNSQPCPAYWKLGDWSSCNCGEANEKVEKVREVKCVQELISGVVIQVNSGACDEKPISTLPCDCVMRITTTKAPVRVEPQRKNPSILQNLNTQSDQKIYGKHKPPKLMKQKKHGMWLSSDWSDTCTCGEGQQFRTIFCDRTPPNNERCDLRQTPNTYRECEMTTDCVGEWFIGPWGPCEGDCFSNATKIRTVICIKNNGFAEENECDLKTKPVSFEDCKIEDMKECRPKWHISEWTECSKACGKGFQKRIIKCLEVDKNDKILRESKNCKYSERPIIFRHCNTHDCSENTTEYDSKIDVIQNDDPSCQDQFSNCDVVLKSKLCGYHYYNENCCQTCRMISNELY